MEDIIRFVVNYEVGIYIIVGIVFLINLQRLLSAWASLRKANFGLEKEISQKRIRSSLTFVILMFLFALSNFILVSIASIRYPGISQIADEDARIQSQTQTAIAITGCIPEQLEWVDPLNGDELEGSIELIGTVNVPNLGFYKYEYRYQGDEFWIPISAENRPVIEGPLGGIWNTESLQPGNYFLRIVVSDNANNLLKPCQIEVKVLPQ